MSSRYEYPQFNAVGTVSNETGSLTLVAEPGPTLYLYVEKISISVFSAAVGGGGVVRVQDTLGNNVWTVNADGVKDVILSFGEEGVRVGQGVGLVAVTADAGGNQASASVGVAGHLSFR